VLLRRKNNNVLDLSAGAVTVFAENQLSALGRIR
jgi:hypothetical protein